MSGNSCGFDCSCGEWHYSNDHRCWWCGSYHVDVEPTEFIDGGLFRERMQCVVSLNTRPTVPNERE